MSLKPKLFWRANAEDEVNADLAFHLDMTTRLLVEQGMTESQARAEAERRFGNVNAVNAQCRELAEDRDRHTARFNTLLLSTLGAIALTLAMIGVYGVVAYFVSQRTQEIALRMALGATPANIWQFVVKRGLSPLLAGLALGTVLAVVAARVLESQLYRVSPTDPLTFAATALLLLGVSLVATYAPARRAIRVTPVVALNE